MLEDITALLKQISLGEDSILEFKNIKFDKNKIVGPHRNSMADELAAMANTHTGLILLGVDDKTKTICGIPKSQLDIIETWVRNISNDLIEPPLNCIICKVAIPDNNTEKYIIRIDVPKSLFVHQSPSGYFYRIGSSKRQMKPDFLARLFQQRSQTRLIRFDEQIVANSGLNDLNPQLCKRFKTVLSPEDDQEFLTKIKMISTDNNNHFYPTVSGILMASDNPESFISNAFIQAVCYRTEQRNAAYQLDAKEITGPLDMQIQEACKFVERNMRIYAIKAPNRIEFPQFSINAIFEAIVNAVAHRDYSIYGSKIRLHMFSDKVEIFSPGAIPNTIRGNSFWHAKTITSNTIASLTERQSTRNELLTSLLARCPMNVNAVGSKRSFIMDKRGEGVPIILSESLSLSGRKPVYRLIDDSELMLTIFTTKPPYQDHQDSEWPHRNKYFSDYLHKR
jgi:predicted HTH transcriptional regulator